MMHGGAVGAMSLNRWACEDRAAPASAGLAIAASRSTAPRWGNLAAVSAMPRREQTQPRARRSAPGLEPKLFGAQSSFPRWCLAPSLLARKWSRRRPSDRRTVHGVTRRGRTGFTKQRPGGSENKSGAMALGGTGAGGAGVRTATAVLYLLVQSIYGGPLCRNCPPIGQAVGCPNWAQPAQLRSPSGLGVAFTNVERRQVQLTIRGY
jgi:hypothetical protein